MRRSGFVTASGAAALALGVALVLMLPAAALAEDIEPTAEALEEQIWEMRLQAGYAEAAALALELLALRRGDPGTPAHEIGDAGRLAELLDTAAGLPDYVQRELAEADSMADVLMPLWDAARYADGIEVARRQLGIRRKILGELNSDVSESLNELGLFLLEHGSHTEAISRFREVLAIDRVILGEHHPEFAMGLSNLGLTLHYIGDNAGAEPLLREALAIQRGVLGDDHVDICFSLNNLALVLIELGEYPEAESLLRRSLAIRRRDLPENDRELPTSLCNLAGLLRLQGDDAEAEPLYREALAAARRIHGSMHPETADVLNGLGVFYNEKQRYEEAEGLLREALAIKDAVWGREHPGTVLTMMNLGNTLAKRDDYDNGEPLIREALALFRKIGGDEHPDVALALSSLGTCLRRRGHFSEAEQALSEAVEIRRNTFGEMHPGVAGYRHNLAVLLWWQGEDEEAEAVLEAAAEGYEASRPRAGARMKRTTFRLQSPFRVLAAVRLGLGKPEEAWEATERGMGRSLADLIFAARGQDARGEKEARVDSLARLVGRLEDELAAYARAAKGDTAAVAAERFRAARDRLLHAHAELSGLRQEVATECPPPEAEIFPIERVGAVLGEHTAVIGWIDVPWRSDRVASWGYVIRSPGTVFWAPLKTTLRSAKEGEHFGYIASFKRHLASPGTALLGVERDARDLWDERVLPLLPALRLVEELIVIPSGPVVDYPLESLVDHDGVFAGDRYSISYAPSATVYTWLRESDGTRLATTGDRSLLVGDPPFSEDQLAAMEEEERTGERIFANATASLDSVTIRSVMAGNERMRGGLPRLPGTRSEVLGLTQVCPRATVLVGGDASEQTLVRLAETGALGDFDVIHFATHALVDYGRPERSVLVLSQVGLPEPLDSAMAGTRVYDGLVSAGEIIREWDLDAELVTLSACETARGRMVMGEGSVGFAHAFLESGARSVVVGLWKVQDEATALLMRRFYENLFGEYEDERKGRVGEAMSKAEALQDAKMWLRGYTDEHGSRPYEHPYYWSAFVLLGDRE